MDDTLKDSAEKSKVIRLVDYLTRLASLRTKIIRDVSEYQNVLWIKDIPRQKGCFTQAWGRDEDFDSDVWIEVETQREPELPSAPVSCKDWIDKSSLRNKTGSSLDITLSGDMARVWPAYCAVCDAREQRRHAAVEGGWSRHAAPSPPPPLEPSPPPLSYKWERGVSAENGVRS